MIKIDYKEILEDSLDIMSESVEFIKDRNIANITNKDIMEFYKIFNTEFRNLTEFLLFIPHSDNFTRGKRLSYIDYLNNYLNGLDAWGRNNYEQKV